MCSGKIRTESHAFFSASIRRIALKMFFSWGLPFMVWTGGQRGWKNYHQIQLETREETPTQISIISLNVLINSSQNWFRTFTASKRLQPKQWKPLARSRNLGKLHSVLKISCHLKYFLIALVGLENRSGRLSILNGFEKSSMCPKCYEIMIYSYRKCRRSRGFRVQKHFEEILKTFFWGFE